MVVDIAIILMNEFQPAQAETILRSVRIHNDSDNNAVFWLAWSLLEQDKYDDALKHFDKCIERFTEEDCLARCHAGKGFIYEDLNQKDKAIAEFTLAQKISPDHDDVKNALNRLMP